MAILFPRPTKIFRTAGGEYVDGIWQEAERVPLEIQANVQSYAPSETKPAPVGWKQGMAACVLYSNAVLNVASYDKKNSGDVVEWQGKYFRIMSKAVYPYLLSHYKYIGLEELDFHENGLAEELADTGMVGDTPPMEELLPSHEIEGEL